ncbi:MAG: VOC family protein [Myxococcaceae bacterium]
MAKVSSVPQGLHSVTVSLTLDGASEAIDFFRRAFGAEELSRVPDPTGKKVWHAMVRIGDSVLFVNDTFPDMGATPTPARMWLYGDGVDAAFKRATQAGASAKMPPADMFWGDRIAEVSDRWGNGWMLAQHIRDLTPNEMKKAQDDFIASTKK